MMRLTAVLPGGVVIALLLGIVPSAGGAAGTQPGVYPIHIHTRSLPGERYRVERSDASVRWSALTWDGRDDRPPAVSDVGTGRHCVADTQVLSVNEDGDPTALVRVVQSWTRTLANGKEEQILPPGSRVEVRLSQRGPAKGQPEYTLDGKPAPARILPVLRLLVRVAPLGQKSDEDAIYGSAQPRRIGESWAINAHLLAERWRRGGQEVHDADVSGKVTLAGVETINGILCLRLEGEVTQQPYCPPDPRRSRASSRPAGSAPVTTAATRGAATFSGAATVATTAPDRSFEYTVKPGTWVRSSTWLIPADGQGEYQQWSYRVDAQYATSGSVKDRTFAGPYVDQYDSENRLLSFTPGP